MRSADQDISAASVVLLFVAALAFVSPLTYWWMAHTPPWWLVYLLWLFLLVPVGFLSRWMSRHEP